MEYELVIAKMVNTCAEAGKLLAQQLAARGEFQPLYLYFKKSTEKECGELVLVADNQTAPDGFELATGEGLRSNVPYVNYFQWVRDRIGRLPILAYGA
jgi:hypothetical protein